ncbi:hypothetical protein AL073_16815 [Loktanella sp. 1ANDIMAR09]|nr:hypothetical protein AL073_16815 [Loktanella sp. 1ANDIMAR09]
MATIRQLKSGKWNVQVRLAGKPARSHTVHSRHEAEQWAQEQELPSKFVHPRLGEAGEEYARIVLGGRPSQELFTLQMKRFGNRQELTKPISKITLQDLNAYKIARLSEVSTTTVRDDLVKIIRVIRWYVSEWRARSGELLPDPCDGLVLPKARRARDTVITREQLALLLEAMTPMMAEVVELAFETAMRRSEILRLRRNDLHLKERYLRVVEGKEGSRDVPLTRRAVTLLEAARGRCSAPDDALYPYASYSVSQAVRRARIQLGLSSDVRFHQLRHSRITEVARKGLNQAQIMVVSGHRDIRSVQRYTHLNVRDVIDLID